MPIYRIEILGAPDEVPRLRRNIQASDDKEAVEIANGVYMTFAATMAVRGFVLYDGDRIVHEQL